MKHTTQQNALNLDPGTARAPLVLEAETITHEPGRRSVEEQTPFLVEIGIDDADRGQEGAGHQQQKDNQRQRVSSPCFHGITQPSSALTWATSSLVENGLVT